MTRPWTFTRTLFVVMGIVATLSVPGSAVAQHSEGPALFAPGAGLQAPPDREPGPEPVEACTLPTPTARPTETPALEAGGQSENGLQDDLRAWLKPHTQPRVFTTAESIVNGPASGHQRV